MSWAIQVFSSDWFRKQWLGLLLVTDPPQGRQHVGERGFLLVAVPGPEGEAEESMAVWWNHTTTML